MSAGVKALIDKTLDPNVEECPATIGRNRVPAFGAFVTVDADTTTANRRRSEVRQDQREVTGLGDHRMGAIGIALMRPARVRVDVRDDGEPSPLTEFPEVAEVATVEPYDPGVQATRIEIVIGHEIDDSDPPVPARAEEKGPALTSAPPASTAKLREEPTPKEPGT